jgi:hypothetical protein
MGDLLNMVGHDTVATVTEIPFRDISKITPLFQQVFNSTLSPEMLAWKYDQGRGRSYGYFSASGELLAHCGIFYRTVLAEGKVRRIAQLGDLMARPGKHGGLSRSSSPFAVLIRRVLDDVPGGDNPDALAFGFPSERAMRVGEHLGLFASIDQMRQLVFEELPGQWYSDRCLPVGIPDAAFMRTAGRLWQQMADALGGGLLGVRDGGYLVQRYFNHPLFKYTCYSIRPWWGGMPFGIVVIRSIDEQQCELMDVIAAPGCMPGIVRAVRRQMGVWGCRQLLFWTTDRHAGLLQDQASRTDRLEFRIMANPFSSAGNPERFAGRWWLTSGDTDYH